MAAVLRASQEAPFVSDDIAPPTNALGGHRDMGLNSPAQPDPPKRSRRTRCGVNIAKPWKPSKLPDGTAAPPEVPGASPWVLRPSDGGPRAIPRVEGANLVPIAASRHRAPPTTPCRGWVEKDHRTTRASSDLTALGATQEVGSLDCNPGKCSRERRTREDQAIGPNCWDQIRLCSP